MKTSFIFIVLFGLLVSGRTRNAYKSEVVASAQETVIEFSVDFDYWEGCETGRGDCKPLLFERPANADSVIVVLPCGGTATTVNLYKLGEDEALDSVSVSHDECPPIFNLTHQPDGDYMMYMLSCGLGGPVEFTLKTIED